MEIAATGPELSRNSCDATGKAQPVRSIRGNRRSVTGVYAFRGDTSIEFESTLERDFLVRQEFSLDVLDVVSQPCQIAFTATDGRRYPYTPDYLVYYRLGDASWHDYPRPMLVEVKPQSEWRCHWRKWLSKWKAAHRYAREQGWTFHIHDESRIRDQTFRNIAFLQRYVRMEFPREEGDWIVQSVRDCGCSSFDHLVARHFMGIYRAEGIAHVWHLLATRRLDCDMSQPLSHRTELWATGHGR